MIKICSICKIEKNEEDFSAAEFKHATHFRCKLCVKTYNIKYRQNNSEKVKKQRKNHYNLNKDRLLSEHREWYQENKEEQCEKKKEYYQENKISILEYNKEYYKENKEDILLYHRQYHKERSASDHQYKLRKLFSSSIFNALGKNGGSKNGSSYLKYIPYTIEDLEKHLEKQFEWWMNWNNQGMFILENWNDNNSASWRWQIDHIIPQSNFYYTSMLDRSFQDCWALSNLRPYSAKQNLLDGNRRKIEKIHE